MTIPTGKIVLMVCFLFLLGCNQPEKKLRVGINTWPGYEPLSLARDLGFFHGQPIEIVNLPSTAECIRAYRNGVIDVVAATLDEAFYAAEGKTGQRIILVCDYSNGADRIMAHPQFKTLADLRGHRIGLEFNALGSFVLTRALEKAGLSVKDFTIVPVPLNEHERAYHSNLVDAIITFEPRCTRLKSAGAQTVFDSSQLPGEIVDLLLCNEGTIKQDNRKLVSLIKGWFQALKYLREHTGEAAKLAAKHQELTPEEFVKALEGMELPDWETNRRLLGKGEGNISATVQRMETLMREKGLLKSTDSVEILPDDSILRQAAP